MLIIFDIPGARREDVEMLPRGRLTDKTSRECMSGISWLRLYRPRVDGGGGDG